MTNEKNASRVMCLNETDVKCVKLSFSILIECAKSHKTLTYTELNDKLKDKVAKQKNQRTIGRRIEWIDCFTDPKNLPKLTSLVVRKDTRKTGKGFVIDGKVEDEQQKCFRCKNWREGEIDDFLKKLGGMLGYRKARNYQAF